MFFKKKCPNCGAKNSKDRMTCATCGASLYLGQDEGQVTKVPQEGKPTVMTPTQETQRAPEHTYPLQPIAKSAQRTATGFFDRIEERLRDKRIDELCAGLCAIGLHAQLAELGRPEEHVGARFGRAKSIGLIEIQGSPIRWVSVLKEESWGGQLPGQGVGYINIYLIPDPSVRQETPPEFIRVTAHPVFGPVDKLRWEGRFSDAFTELTTEEALRNQSLTKLRGTIRRLNEDAQFNQSLIRLDGYYIDIRSYPKWGCWIIAPQEREVDWWGRYRQPAPSRELWECYETIARHLLGTVESKEI